MNQVITLAVIIAVVFETLHILLDFYILKRIETKDKILAQCKVVLSFVVTAFIIYIMFSGFYVVQTNDKVVLDKITGKKVIVEDVGIHYSFMSQTESFFMGKQNLEFPTFQDFTNADLSELYGEAEMVSLDDKVIRFSAVLYYQITDLNKFAIQSQDTKEKLFYYLNSEITNQISNTLYKDAIENRKQLETDIKNSFKEFEEIYGIKILDFNFMRITDSAITINAKVNAENKKIQAEAMINSTLSEMAALRIKTKAEREHAEMLEGSSQKVLDYILEMEKYSTIKERSGDVIWIIPDGNTPIISR